MRHPKRLVVLLVVPAALAFASADSADDAEWNARLVEKYRRDDPGYYDRLRRDLRAFYQLPSDRQERMRALDRTLREQDSATQRHLWEVLDRFNAWLDRLPEEDRRRVEETTDRAERLRLIRELREKEFVHSLPKKVREELDSLPPDRKAARIAQIRQEELAVRQTWNPRPNYPVRPSDLWLAQQLYYEKVLRPMLTPSEKDELRQAEGQWPEFARVLLRLVDKHQFKGPTRNASHPADVRALMVKSKQDKKERAQLHDAEGKFPEYAEAFMRLALRHQVAFRAAPGPGRLEDLSPIHQSFVTETLLPLLDAAEKQELGKIVTSERKWPDYPAKLIALAAKYDKEIPYLDFPGADDLRARCEEAPDLPEVPDRVLREFFAQLTEAERNELRVARISSDDPEGRDRVRQEYFKRYPKARDRLRDLDKRALSPKKGAGALD